MSVTKFFWVPGSTNAIDVVNAKTGLSVFSGETLEQVRERYPGAVITGGEEIDKAIDLKYKHPPVEIERQRFLDMLCILPPEDWTTRSGAETFKMSEMTAGTITTIFCRIGGRYFEMSDDASMSHDDIAQACVPVKRTGSRKPTSNEAKKPEPAVTDVMPARREGSEPHAIHEVPPAQV